MPLIETRLNIALSKEKETVLKSKLGEAISLFPGKSEYWLMLEFRDQCHLWFRGYDSFPIAMVEVKLFGGADEETCARMTKTICDLFKTELGNIGMLVCCHLGVARGTRSKEHKRGFITCGSILISYELT